VLMLMCYRVSEEAIHRVTVTSPAPVNEHVELAKKSSPYLDAPKKHLVSRVTKAEDRASRSLAGSGHHRAGHAGKSADSGLGGLALRRGGVAGPVHHRSRALPLSAAQSPAAYIAPDASPGGPVRG